MNILVLDDDNLSRNAVTQFLKETFNFNVSDLGDSENATEFIKQNKIDFLLTDIKMPTKTGIDVLREIKADKELKHVYVVLMTGFADLESAVEALRLGAYDYLQKPINIEEIAVIIERINEKIELKKENALLKTQLSQKEVITKNQNNRLNFYRKTFAEIRGYGKIGIFSDEFRNIVELADKFNDDPDLPVLIEGSTGTGKEIIANIVHFGMNKEIEKPFIPVNCASLSANLFESELFGYEAGAFTGGLAKGNIGKLELAQGGTIFLDEIGELPLELQPKLLRVIQQKEMYKVGGTQRIELNVRIIGATNKNLKQMVQDGSFREDLYFRLNIGQIFIPPLNERKSEVAPLAQHFLNIFSKKRKKNFKFIHKSAQSILENYKWPGNVRELENTIERVTLLYDGTELFPEHISFLGKEEEIKLNPNILIPGKINLPESPINLEELESEIVEKALKKFNYNKTQTAEYLGVTRSALRSRISKLE